MTQPPSGNPFDNPGGFDLNALMQQAQQMQEQLEKMGFQLPQEAFMQKFAPGQADLSAAHEWGTRFAQAVKSHSASE